MTVKCNVCQGNWRRGRGSLFRTVCPGCARTRSLVRRANVRAGGCQTPHPDLEARIAEYARRAEAGRPLFGG